MTRNACSSSPESSPDSESRDQSMTSPSASARTAASNPSGFESGTAHLLAHLLDPAHDRHAHGVGRREAALGGDGVVRKLELDAEQQGFALPARKCGQRFFERLKFLPARNNRQQ